MRAESKLNLSRQDHRKSGTGDSSQMGSDDVEGKPQMIEMTTTIEWPKDGNESPRTAESSMPPSPQHLSPLVQDALLPKASRRAASPGSEKVEKQQQRYGERGLTGGPSTTTPSRE